MTTVAFLGTGLMGAALAEAAARRGETVSAWNRTAAKAAPLAAFGVRVADTVAGAVTGAARVHLVLSNDEAVDAALAAAGDALVGTVVVDHSTVSPAGVLARAARLAARGIAFVHAPVFMSPAMCRAAGGMMLCAGPREVFARVEPALRAMTGTLDYVGERGDLAAAYKLFGNAMIVTLVAGLADVFAMAASLGIPSTDAHALFSRFNPAGVLTYRGAAMATGQYAASFELTMARKDVGLMLDAAGSAELAVLPTIAARMDELIKQGYGAQDVGVLSVGAVPPAG